MREAIGGTAIFQIVIFFILLFTGFICLALNHSKAFNVKDEIVRIIEKDNGFADKTAEEIAAALKENGYRTTGNCPDGYTGYNREGKIDSRNSAFCVRFTDTRPSQELPSMAYYRVIVFYQLDLPIFKELFSFQLTGDTKTLFQADR